MLADLLRDARFGVRQMARTPAFSMVAILTIGLGIGATGAIFSVVNGVLLRPLPYPDPDRLVRIHEVVSQFGRFSVAPGTFLDWKKHNEHFADLAAYSTDSVSIVGDDGPEQVVSAAVSAELFGVLGVRPALGRSFTSEEDGPGAAGVVVVLSHGTWQRRFGADPGVLGRSLTLSGRPATVIGVMPAGFYYPTHTVELWTPLALDPAQASRGAHYLGVVSRRKPGVSTEQADAAMKTIAARLAREYPETNAGESADVVPLIEHVVGGVRPALLTLFAAVGVVVMIACLNVANLLLVRASVREREIAIRTALGAGRRRIAVQLLAESLVLAAAGGALGLLLARLAIPAIQTLSAGEIPRVADVAIDARVLSFAALVSLLTGLGFGLAPVWQARRSAPGEALREGSRGTASARAGPLRSGLLVGEVALSIVLLVGAALLLRSFGRLTSVDPGFDPEGVLAFQVSLPEPSYPETHQRLRFYDDLLARLRSVPGVGSAGMVQRLPMRGGYFLSFSIAGRPPARPGEDDSARYRTVSPGYFETLRIPLLRGRAIDDGDGSAAPMVAVVDRAFADRHFPGQDPIGHGLDIGNGSDGLYSIVGVVGNVHHDGLDATPGPTMYVPSAQDSFGTMWMVVRGSGDPEALASAARAVVHGLDAGLPAARMGPLAEAVSDSVAQRRFSMLLLALFAAIALFLAAVGLYGVVAYTVTQRTREIGVRMAIGARRSDVLRLVVGGGLRLALLGVVVGTGAALALARLLESMLYEVTPFDPLSYLATAGVLLAVAAVACFVPAARAAGIDPLLALRQE